MATSTWFLLRHIREALKNGRPELAHPLVRQLTDIGHKAAFRYEGELARCYLDRAERHLSIDDIESAWDDLNSADSLGYAGPEFARVRDKLTRLALVELRAMLEAGRPEDVEETVALLRARGLRHPDLQAILACAREWRQGLELAETGDFVRAIERIKAVRPNLPCPPRGLEECLAELAERETVLREAMGKIRAGAEGGRWGPVLAACDEALAAAPDNVEARQARTAAWQSMTSNTLSYQAPSSTEARPQSDSSAGGIPKRFLLWFDGVGGFLICTGTRVAVGQAGGAKPVDVPVCAALAAVHVTLVRDGEGYMLESGQDVLVNGEHVERSYLLAHDARVVLARTCQFHFAVPNQLSRSAAIRLTSNHRLPDALDAALLLAQNVAFGPGPDAHVNVPHLRLPVLLARDGDGLAVHHAESFCVNGERFEGRASVEIGTAGCSVHGDDFSFSLEPVPPKFATI